MCNGFFACKKSDAALDAPLSDLRRHKIISEGEHNMNYTKNYRLPQWVKEDRIMMDDFNAAMNSMESGMTKTAAQASAARADASEAKQTADTAHSIAQQINGSAYTPSNKPYKVGSYVGNGSSMTVNLGFRPSFVVISGMEGSPSTSHYDTYDRYFAMTEADAVSRF